MAKNVEFKALGLIFDRNNWAGKEEIGDAPQSIEYVSIEFGLVKEEPLSYKERLDNQDRLMTQIRENIDKLNGLYDTARKARDHKSMALIEDLKVSQYRKLDAVRKAKGEILREMRGVKPEQEVMTLECFIKKA